jgi:hypothetical protein
MMGSRSLTLGPKVRRGSGALQTLRGLSLVAPSTGLTDKTRNLVEIVKTESTKLVMSLPVVS